ncbi:MAG TPA: hypothetical protein VK785_09455 [Opitutaceae bacterium]|jgi:hypothetical protein|nr:hypothetical protein [Opitutaceae bacterium]
MNDSIKQRYIARYTEAVGKFIHDVGDVNAAGIPEVHLPLYGAKYEKASPRIAFIGRDTWCWGGMEGFLECAKPKIQAVIPTRIREDEFLTFPFKKGGSWAAEGNSIFWDTVMRCLAAFHGVHDWKQIKEGGCDDILQSFVWANTNAVEIWEKKKLPEWEKKLGKKANRDAHRRLKSAATKHFDSFSAIQEIFQPHVAIIMSKKAPKDYWGTVPQSKAIGNGVNYVFDSLNRTHIFHTVHPMRFSFNKVSAKEVVDTIFSKWQAVQGAV